MRSAPSLRAKTGPNAGGPLCIAPVRTTSRSGVQLARARGRRRQQRAANARRLCVEAAPPRAPPPRHLVFLISEGTTFKTPASLRGPSKATTPNQPIATPPRLLDDTCVAHTEAPFPREDPKDINGRPDHLRAPSECRSIDASATQHRGASQAVRPHTSPALPMNALAIRARADVCDGVQTPRSELPCISLELPSFLRKMKNAKAAAL